MRTTLDIDDTLMHLAKQAAIKTHKPLRAVVEEALREKFLRGETPVDFQAIKLIVSKKTGGPLPGIDLDNSADLADAMERTDAAV